MRYATVLLAPMFCALWASTSTWAGSGTQAAREAFDSVFSADVQRVKAARDPKATVELATRMIATAKEAKSQPAFQAVLCEKAYELTAAIPSGQPLAIEAMTLLAACAPEKAIQSADAIAEVRQRQFETARGEDRPKAGEALLDAILKGADLRAQAGAATDACTIYRRAQAIAASIKSDRRPAIEARAKELSQAVKTAADAETLKKQLEANPGDAAVRERLVRLYLVCFDDPAAAAKYLEGVADAALTKFVPAVVKGVEAAPEMACYDIAGWYCGLAEAAPAAGAKAAMLSHAKTYYMRFLELHLTDDLERTKVWATLKKVDADLEKLSAPPQAAGGSRQPASHITAAEARKSIDLLVAVDLTQDVVSGAWERRGPGIEVAAKASRWPRLLLLPAMPQGSYEVEAKFVRTAGAGTVIAILPVGGRSVALCMSWNNGMVSALEQINGKGPKDNETGVRPGALQNNHEYALLIKVMVEGTNAQVAVSLDGKPYISWQGPVSALSLFPNLRLPHAGCFGLGACDATVAFSNVRLRMLSGEAKPLRP